MKAIYILPAVALVAAAALSSIFTVDEREKVLVLQFGEIKQVIDQPGLYFKLPVIQDILRYDDRILGLTTAPQEFPLADNRRLVVDAFARWRIVDLQKFRRAVGSGGVDAASANLAAIVSPEVRDVLGEATVEMVLSSSRVGLMNKIRDNARVKAASLGVDIIDVRLTRTDLPQQNLQATFARMQAERQREATDEIARGNEAAQTLRAEAERTSVEITSEANKQAEIVRGQADAKRVAIYAQAYGKDPEFFAFTRSLTAYGKALPGDNTSIVMSPDSEFFQYFNAESPALAPVQLPAETSAVTGSEAGATGNGATVAGGSAPIAP